MSDTVHAKVTLTVQVQNVGTWGDDCTLAQIKDQAIKSAVGRLRRCIEGEAIQIIGEPSADAIWQASRP